MNRDYWTGKKVLFMGPGPTSLTADIINSFDIVVRTNGFFHMTLADMVSPRCDVIMINDIYTKQRFGQVASIASRVCKMVLGYRANMPYLSTIVGCGLDYFDTDHQRFHGFPFRGKPLLLSRFIAYLWRFEPAELFVTGVSFYSGSMQIHPVSYRMGFQEVPVHRPEDDMEFFKYAISVRNWITYDPIIANILAIPLRKSAAMEEYAQSIGI